MYERNRSYNFQKIIIANKVESKTQIMLSDLGEKLLGVQ